jgi:hypothetical protein
MAEITEHDDILDSRTIIERIEELEEVREPLQDAVDEDKEWLSTTPSTPDNQQEVKDKQEHYEQRKEELKEWDESDEAEELKALKAFAEECESNSEWESGMTLINESYFQDYAKEFAEDLGLISSETKWPATCIDWEQAATELRMDYTSYEFGDTTFYCNS